MAKIGDSNTEAEFSGVTVNGDTVSTVSDLTGLASETYVDNEVSNKADVSYVDSEVSTRAPLDGGGTVDLTNYDTISASTINADNLSGLSEGPTANIMDYGASGDGSDDTSAFQSAFSDLSGGGELFVPKGVYVVSEHLTVPEGIIIKGEGRSVTTLRSTYTGGALTFSLSSESAFYDMTIDQNSSGRGRSNTTGLMLNGVDNCHIERCNFINLSVSSEGVGIYLDADESDSQDTHSNVVRDCKIVGDWQNGSNTGDFLIRARTSFNSSLETSQFTRFVRDNLFENCMFTGQGKSALELVGPATVENRVVNCTARDFTTCTGIFESSLGAKRNVFIGCSILDCYGSSTCIGFYSDGHTNTGTPDRFAEDDLYLGCRVDGLHQTNPGSDIRAFRARKARRIKFADCIAENVTTNSADGYGIGIDVNGSDSVIIDGMRFKDADWGISISACNALNVNNPNFIGTSIEVNRLSSNNRPRWNGVLGGGKFGGVDLSSTSGNSVGDEAMSDGNDAPLGMKAVWNGSSWRVSDGSLV